MANSSREAFSAGFLSLQFLHSASAPAPADVPQRKISAARPAAHGSATSNARAETLRIALSASYFDRHLSAGSTTALADNLR
jgi:hypothetical protein